jgi:glycosyltransferase involved in cell wall biosynthesis
VPRVTILSNVHDALDNRVFYREACSLHRAGYDVTLIAIHPQNEIKDGIKIIGLPEVRRWQRPLLWIRLLSLALATDADAFHFHDPELLLVTPWLHLLTGKPTIYDVHEAYPDFFRVKDYLPTWIRYPLAWIFEWLEPLLARLQSGLVFADDQIAAAFEDVDRPKTTLFNFPAQSFVEQAAITTREVKQREPIVLYLGGMERNRGAQLMVEAFAQVVAEFPEAQLLHVGHYAPPGLENEVRAAITAHSIAPSVKLTGRVPFEQIGDYLKRAAVGWVTWQPLPKNEKNIPTKLFEYMAYSVPIVSSDLASTRPFIQPGENGYLVTAEDPSAHAAAMLHLLRHPAQARAMGKRGRRKVRKDYNWSEMEKRMLAFYEDLLL